MYGDAILDWWIISDTHFGHKNIIRFCNRPENHEEIMTANWHDRVFPNETILHLGDVVTWKESEYRYSWLDVVHDLPGKKMLIMGNHDQLSRRAYQRTFNIIEPFIQEINGVRYYFSHFPEAIDTDLWDVCVHGHKHNRSIKSNPQYYLNTCVEVQNYRPRRLRWLIQEHKEKHGGK